MMLDEHTSIKVYMDKGDCFRCHCLRVVLSRKRIEYTPIFLDSLSDLPANVDEDYAPDRLPLLTDRHIGLSDLLVMSEYLDERFPYPPMMPLDPVSRARTRLSLLYVYGRWGGLVDRIKDTKAKVAGDKLRKGLLNELADSVGMFGKRFMGGSDFSLLDSLVTTILWRLPGLGVALEGKQTEPLRAYQKRAFDLPEFRACRIESDDDLHSPA